MQNSQKAEKRKKIMIHSQRFKQLAEYVAMLQKLYEEEIAKVNALDVKSANYHEDLDNDIMLDYDMCTDYCDEEVDSKEYYTLCLRLIRIYRSIIYAIAINKSNKHLDTMHELLDFAEYMKIKYETALNKFKQLLYVDKNQFDLYVEDIQEDFYSCDYTVDAIEDKYTYALCSMLSDVYYEIVTALMQEIKSLR